VKKPKSRTAGVSATEHGRARATIEQLQARIEELEQELESTHTVDVTPDAEKARRSEIENVGLRSEIEELRELLKQVLVATKDLPAKLREQIERVVPE
jgi:predicted nuclease with TOPRIM domain